MSVRVVAPCRLHFGLFHVPVDDLTHHPDGRRVRKFGGLGLMIDQPCVTVNVQHQREWEVAGNAPERSREVAQRVSRHMDERLRSAGLSLRRSFDSYSWRIGVFGAAEHVGLGVGTAQSMAIVRCMTYSPDHPRYQLLSMAEMADCANRGRRSGIGVHGFESGGFIADDGKVGDELPQLAERLDFPSDWRVVLVRPPTPPVWFGDRERTAFARTRHADRALSLTDRLRSLAYDTVVPAVRTADFDTFAASIFEFNRLAGEPFHDDQGGPYASPEVACVIDELIEMGAVGVGQSSWGPTVFAFAPSADEAEHLANRARERFSSATDVTVTAANNTGARLEAM